MQFHAGNRHFIAGAQQGAGGGKTFAAARTQVVHAQVDGSIRESRWRNSSSLMVSWRVRVLPTQTRPAATSSAGGDHPAMQNALRPVADHHRLIIKAKLGKRFFVAFEFETEGALNGM
ncbi:Uncharacterised protein [Klebsiella pneumoniae]|uniref:Uncharacterized protein n=1 Tax=Klebsiella pneumoniae TaxID=573 RepID=A0A2X3CYN9_KLEPN|nr:Uncharacterised protein [Klebsiella pneumoniae]